MASSRVFVRGLPPTLTEVDFKRHFSQQGNITDVRLFQQRRIGYVGYETPEIAKKAVRYFNRTFMKMSKIAVEIATPVKATHHVTNTATTGVDDKSSRDSRSLKRKRDGSNGKESDPKLQEFLDTMRPAPTKRQMGDVVSKHDLVTQQTEEAEPLPVPEDVISKPAVPSNDKIENRALEGGPVQPLSPDESAAGEEANAAPTEPDAKDNERSDSDWLRSRTSRLLDIESDDELDTARDKDRGTPTGLLQEASRSVDAEPTAEVKAKQKEDDEPLQQPHQPTDDLEAKIRDTSRLYLRNLAYNVTEADLTSTFSVFGTVQEAHLPLDSQTGNPKGFAYVMFADPEHAVEAWRQLDGTIMLGRLLHILPASAKRETLLDDFEISKLPLKKQQQIKRRREAATTQYNWNSLYLNADAVISSVADRFGLTKSQVLDPTSSEAAVKQAHAETHMIQTTKAYFEKNGVDLDAFKSQRRGDIAILVKNIPYDVKAIDLRNLFEQHGPLRSFLMPPSGIVAIAAFEQAAHAKAAFAALAYKKLQNSVLFLEKAPIDIFNGKKATQQDENDSKVTDQQNATTADLLHDKGPAISTTLFIRNLNFSTTSERLSETFKPLDGFLTARVKTKTDAKKPGKVLSMGFGFLEFKSSPQANAALAAMDGYELDGHKLQIRVSEKAMDAAEATRQADKQKKDASRGTKIIIKNLPFETSKKDIRALFGAYGQLKSVRMPTKMDRSIRGFAFADFTTQKEASNALDALRDTHLLGRRLVLDYASAEAEDAEAEIEKMQKKVGSQINKVALQNLTGAGRKKFAMEGVADEDVD